MAGQEAASVGPKSIAMPSGRHARACTNCAKMKEKCVFVEDVSNSKCRRCSRLGKECITPTPRKRQRTDNTATKTSTSSYPTPLSGHTTALCHLVAGQDTTGAPSWHGNAATDHESHPVSATLAALPAARKDALFREFLLDMNPYFPFLVLDWKDATACERHAPFTFAACLAAAIHRQYSMQRTVQLEMLQYIGVVMFPGGKKSLDLLYGLNIMTAWFALYHPANHQYMNLVHLAKALLVDLGLSIPSHSLPTFSQALNENPKLGHGSPLEEGSFKLAGLRALLMSWCTNAQVSITGRKLEYPRWNGHLEDCLQKLEAANASPLDVHSIHITRLYRTAERYLGCNDVRQSSGLPIRAYVRCFRDDLQRIRSSLPPSLAANPQFELSLQSVEIALYDTIPTASCDHPAQMLEALHALLARTATFFELFLSQPTEKFPLLPFLLTSQGTLAMDVLAKLSFFQYEGWDLSYVRSNYSFSSCIERTMDKFEEVFNSERARFPDLETSRFAIYPMKLRQYVKWYERRLAQEAKEALENAQVATESRDIPDLELSNQYLETFGDPGWWTYDGSF